MALGQAELIEEWYGPVLQVSDVQWDTVYRFQLLVNGGPMAGASNYLEVRAYRADVRQRYDAYLAALLQNGQA